MATESFKVKSGFFLEIKKIFFVFQENETYNLKSDNHLAQKKIRTLYGIESIFKMGANI